MVFPGRRRSRAARRLPLRDVERLSELTRAGLTAPGEAAARAAEAQDASSTAAAEQGDAALDDDLNTPVALAALGEMTRIGNELCDLAQKRKKDASFVGAAAVFGAPRRRAISKL